MFRRGKIPFLSTKDDRIKIINERINQTERHLIEMCSAFALLTRKMAKYRDSYDELAKGVKSYADEEEINESFCTGLKNFTNAVTLMGDYMDINVHRLELKIVNELAAFEQHCKSTRENLRLAVVARDKEMLRQRQMLELKSKFSANNSAADSELFKAKMEVQRANKDIDDIIGNFEQRKLHDVKQILSDFILISMRHHSKALEVLSASYYDVCLIDDKDDFLEFQKLMQSREQMDARKQSLKKGLRSQSLDNLEPERVLSPLKNIRKLSRSSKNLSSATAGIKHSASHMKQAQSEEDEDDTEEQDDDEESEESGDEEGNSGSASDDERERPSTDNVFGAKTRSSSSGGGGKAAGESSSSAAASSGAAGNVGQSSKPARSSVKHPFKAVAATHVRLQKQFHVPQN